MLKILTPLIMMTLSICLIPKKWLWSSTLGHSFMVAFISLFLLKESTIARWFYLSPTLGADSISMPLLVLTCWMFPIMILASQNNIRFEPINRQRSFIALMVSLHIFLILTFAATDFILFYTMFEATLVPTLFLITRWGSQEKRLMAGSYFLFYTLTGSLPLLIALLVMYKHLGSLSLILWFYTAQAPMTAYATELWWLSCLLAFVIKLPLYGLHLWLPKAHVEAPVAGSIVLAAVLLKLGGYGMLRMMPFVEPVTKDLSYPFIVLAVWGTIMTGSMCLRQLDLKALIAYSSVGHMGLVAAGILIQTPWGHSGALTIMIAHGLTSSALFCLANTNYERTNSRTMMLTRGLHMMLPLMSTWWLMAALANLALPPLPNLMGELMIILSLFNWTWISIVLMGIAALITAAYSLYLYLTTQRGPAPTHISSFEPSHTREHLLLILHLIPLLLLTLKPEYTWGVIS
uniref:NADH-ubiquinone oxidoreductase chain 4 n=1 Tax=Draconetta xenica TaxID=215391 RepID=A0A060P0L7_9TELE|nr:NADH dehydrogenase subunit 4 [Draconetta xenica]BAO84689.1 NADH dehydrogenase subunit 4 [Draconetta xenica]